MKKLICYTITVLLLVLGYAASQETGPTKEQIEEIKKQNEKARKANALIQKATKAMNAGKWKEALPLVQQLIVIYPDNWQLYASLGDCFLNTDQHEKAVESYQKGIDEAENITIVDPRNPIADPDKRKNGLVNMLINEGNAYLKMCKSDEPLQACTEAIRNGAIQSFAKAIQLDPNSATAYFNLCATQFNIASSPEVLDTCEEAVALNPDKSEGYFMKGSLLLDMSDIDEHGMTVARPGTVESLKKYLQMSPSGSYADRAKQMLYSIRLSAGDLERLLRAGTASNNAADLVKQRGVDFTLDDSTELRLRKAGATDELLLTIAKGKQ